jgi:hypothetical protein
MWHGPLSGAGGRGELIYKWVELYVAKPVFSLFFCPNPDSCFRMLYRPALFCWSPSVSSLSTCSTQPREYSFSLDDRWFCRSHYVSSLSSCLTQPREFSLSFSTLDGSAGHPLSRPHQHVQLNHVSLVSLFRC